MIKTLFLTFLLLSVYVHTEGNEVQVVIDDSEDQTQTGNYQVKESVYILKDADLKQALQEFEYVLVKFFAPWCGHCKNMAAAYIQTAKTLQTSGSPVKIAQVDCTVNKQVCQQKQIKGYPTLMFFKNGQSVKYTGGRTKQTIISWIQAQTGSKSVQSQQNIGQL